MIEIDCRIANLKYGYIVETMDDGLYRLKYQKWDDGKSWNWNFPPCWAEYDNGASQHIYQYLEDAKRDGNAFMIQKAAYKVIDVGNTYVAWFWNDNESDISKQPINNLILYDERYQEVWNISEFFNASEMCTKVDLVDIDKIFFCTFSGLGNLLEIKNDEIKCIERVSW